MNNEEHSRLLSLRKRAETAQGAGKSATAIVMLEKYVRSVPNDSYATFLLAENLRSLGRVTDAEAMMRSLKDIPASKQWLVSLCWAEIHAIKSRNVEAEAAFKKAIELNPSSTVPWVYYGGWLGKQERFQEAVEVLTNGLAATGDLDEVYLNLGYNKRALYQYGEAKDCFLRALKENPTYLEAEDALGDVVTCIDFLNETADVNIDSISTFRATS